MSRSSCNSRRIVPSGGFTLAEMLVVLAILAVTTTIAVKSPTPLANQTRFESTMRTLDNVSAAIVSTNTSGSSDAAPMVTGYIADTGHFPRLTYNATSNSAVNDLCFQPTDLSIPVFGDASSGGLVSVPFPQLGNPSNTTSFAWGWRGPYVQLPVGGNMLIDGWGNPLLLDSVASSSTAVQLGAQTFASLPNGALAVVSLGNSAASGYSHTLDSLNSMTDVVVTLPATSWQAASIQGKLYVQDGSGNHNSPGAGKWAVTMYGAGPSGVASYKATMTAGGTTVVGEVTASGTQDVTYQFIANDPTNPPWVGPHILYTNNNGGSSTSGSPNWATGRAVYLNVYPGATHLVDLRVQ